MKNHNTIPWAEIFKYSVQSLGISPREFWKMTMIELSYLIDDHARDELPITRNDLNQMIHNLNERGNK